MQKTKIEWCDMTWNPVTGCLHGCEYCYARGIANRFKGFEPRCGGEVIPGGLGTCVGSIYNTTHGDTLHVFDGQPMRRFAARGCPSGKLVKTSYPYNFEPTFHRYKLGEPCNVRKSQNVFVCSMADLFGEWVPYSWISQVFEACYNAPQHRYLFLTKNYGRYNHLQAIDKLPSNPNFWYGITHTGGKLEYEPVQCVNNFISFEPLLDGLAEGFEFTNIKWAIIGAQTGNRYWKIVPKREWVEDIVNRCRGAGVPVFMKDSLADIWGEPLLRELPF